MIALHKIGRGAGVFYILNRPAQLAAGFIQRFAAFLGNGASQFLKMVFQQEFIFEQVLNAFRNRRAPPVRQRCFGGSCTNSKSPSRIGF